MNRSVQGRGTFYEGQDIWLVGQVTLPTGALLTASDVTAANKVTIAVYDLSSSTPTTAVFQDSTAVILGNGSTGAILTPAQTTTVGWDLDPLGANFKLILYDNTAGAAPGVPVWPGSGAARATGGHRYRVEITFATTSYGLA